MRVLETENAAKTATNPPLMERERVLRSASRYWTWRRTQDIVLSVLALAILWPLMLLVAVLIVIDSPGAGPIFSQTRVGRDGKTFKFYKFRSMCPDAEVELEQLLKYNEMDGPAFKMKDDPRITRIGRIIRRTSIDELPQLWNVLRGEMSIVGPRPAIPLSRFRLSSVPSYSLPPCASLRFLT